MFIMYVVVFFLLIWTLFQLNLCEAKCKVSNPSQTVLYILQTKDDIHEKYNKQFISDLKNELDSHRNIKYPLDREPTILKDCPSKLTQTLEDTKNLRYVINLDVGDFYMTNYNYVKNYNLRWVGDIDKVVQVCRNNTEKIRGTKNCIVSNEHRKHAKLASEEVLKIPFLFDFVIDFLRKVKPKIKYHYIVIYTKELILENLDRYYHYGDVNNFFSLVYKSEICNPKFDNISPVNDNAIAVVAPNPECIQETNKPVIFYEEPYFRPEAAAFYRNSILRTRSWMQMADTFLRFIRMMKWNRVAIVSDDSVESEEFESELRSLFSENKLSYIVETVAEMSKCCDFNEALASLATADARIIIANVGQQNAGLLAEQAKNHGLNYPVKHLWIARDWSQDTAREAAEELTRVFTVNPQRTPVKTHLKAILDVIKYNRDNVDYDFFNEIQFARDIRQKLSPMDTSKFIITMTTSTEHRIIGKYENKVGTFYKPFPDIPTDRNSECTFKSTNYYKPCDDLNFILFMLVLAIFSVSLLGITYFFETINNPYNRMTN